MLDSWLADWLTANPEMSLRDALGCTVEQVAALAAMPEPREDRFAADCRAIAATTGVEAHRLIRVLQFVRVLRRLRGHGGTFHTHAYLRG